MGSSSADVLRSLDLASCAAELAVGSLQPELQDPFPKVHNPMPAQLNTSAQQQAPEQQQQQQQANGEEVSTQMDGSSGVLLPKGHLVMKLLQVIYTLYSMHDGCFSCRTYLKTGNPIC